MGIATINYVLISTSDRPNITSSITAGGVRFDGVITSINTQPIANTEQSVNGSWYTTSVSMFAIGT